MSKVIQIFPVIPEKIVAEGEGTEGLIVRHLMTILGERKTRIEELVMRVAIVILTTLTETVTTTTAAMTVVVIIMIEIITIEVLMTKIVIEGPTVGVEVEIAPTDIVRTNIAGVGDSHLQVTRFRACSSLVMGMIIIMITIVKK
jgi:hypothetical protein